MILLEKLLKSIAFCLLTKNSIFSSLPPSEMKAKGYLALQALEKDLYSMSLLDR